MFCSSCGATMQEGAQFCGSCGAKTVASAPPAAAPPPPPAPGFGTPAPGQGPAPTYPPGQGPAPVYPPGQEPAPAAAYAAGQGPAAGAAGPQFMPPAPVAPAPAAEKSGRKISPLMIIGGFIVLALLAGAVFVGTSKLGGDDGSSSLTYSNGIPIPSLTGPSNEQPEEAWKAKNDCYDSDSYCDLVADDDGVFAVVADGSKVEVVSFDAGSGDEQWTARSDESTYLNLTSSYVVATSTEDEDSTEVTAYKRADGDEAWTAKLSSYSYGIGELTDGTLLFGEGDDGKVTALSADDGDELWSKSGSFLAVCDDTVYVDDEGDVVALGLDDGQKAWSAKGSDDLTPSTAACASGGVAVTSMSSYDDYEDYEEEDYEDYEDEEYVDETEYQVAVLSDSDGKELWSETFDVEEAGTVLDSSGSLVFVGGNSKLTAYETSSGKEKWDSDMESEDSYAISIVDGSTLMVAEGGEQARLLSTSSGEESESTGIGSDGLLLTTDSLIVSDEDELSAYDLGTLEDQWSVDVETTGSLAVGGGKVFVLTEDGIEAYG